MQSLSHSNIVMQGFHALSDPLRLKVLDLLREEERCVGDLCDLLEVTQSKLSFHLKTLKEAGLVQARQEGRLIFYSLNLVKLMELEKYLAEYRRFSPILPNRKLRDDRARDDRNPDDRDPDEPGSQDVNS